MVWRFPQLLLMHIISVEMNVSCQHHQITWLYHICHYQTLRYTKGINAKPSRGSVVHRFLAVLYSSPVAPFTWFNFNPRKDK